MAETKIDKQFAGHACERCGGTGIDVDEKAPAVLRKMREELGMSQIEMGRRLGLSDCYISQLEAGHRRLTWEMVAGYRRALAGVGAGAGK